MESHLDKERNRFKAIRRQLGISQERAGEMAGLSRETIINFEQGHVLVNPANRRKLKELLARWESAPFATLTPSTVAPLSVPGQSNRAFLCPACHSYVAGPGDGGNFCMGCGAPLVANCSACGHINPVNQIRCEDCGERINPIDTDAEAS